MCFVSFRIVLCEVFSLCVVALFSQQRLVFTRQTLRERLQQVPERLGSVVGAADVALEAAVDNSFAALTRGDRVHTPAPAAEKSRRPRVQGPVFNAWAEGQPERKRLGDGTWSVATNRRVETNRTGGAKC